MATEAVSDAEAEDMMRADFHADSGADGSVDREEFRFGVFQLADHWTLNIDSEEYRDFLERGYHIVFSDLLAMDKLQLPPSWIDELKLVKNISPIPVARAVDTITGIVRAKINADKVRKCRTRRAGKLRHNSHSCAITPDGNPFSPLTGSLPLPLPIALATPHCRRQDRESSQGRTDGASGDGALCARLLQDQTRQRRRVPQAVQGFRPAAAHVDGGRDQRGE